MAEPYLHTELREPNVNLMKIAEQLIPRATSLVRSWKRRRAIAELISRNSSTMNAVGQALREVRQNAISAEEAELVSLIEARRRGLLSSDKIISVVDYGAGSPDCVKTEDEMRRGTYTTAPVSKICTASKPAFWALFLFKLIRKLKPASCLELGTCVGISASYIAAALSLNTKGKLTTLEGSPDVADIARETLGEMGFGNASVCTGPFHETYEKTLAAANPVDFLFNDGHHDRDATLRYFEQSLPYLAGRAVIVFDDISWSPGMKTAWKQIEDDPRVAATIDLHTMGVAILSNEIAAKEKFRIHLR